MGDRVKGKTGGERGKREQASGKRNFFHFPDGMCVLRVKVFPQCRCQDGDEDEHEDNSDSHSKRETTTTMTLQRCK